MYSAVCYCTVCGAVCVARREDKYVDIWSYSTPGDTADIKRRWESGGSYFGLIQDNKRSIISDTVTHTVVIAHTNGH